MSAGARVKIPDSSAMQSEIVFVPNQLAALATAYLSAEDISATVAGAVFAVSAANQFCPNLGGRNVGITLNEAAGSSLAMVFDVHGYDQFGNAIIERTGSVTEAAPHVGTKIFQRVTKLVVVTTTGNAASDTLSAGYLNKVGIPRMFSSTLEELIGASLIDAAGTTVTAKTVNTTNFDTTYYAAHAALFGGTVTAGDSLAIAYKGSSRTPDDTSRFPARS
jgi:hypothetical protein